LPVVVTVFATVEDQRHQAATEGQAQQGAEDHGDQPMDPHFDLPHIPPQVGGKR